MNNKVPEISQQGNVNYAAQVITVPAAKKVENSDRLYTLDVLGTTVVGDNSWLEREGEKAILFFAESQLSDEVASGLNLYRHREKNADPSETGYLEDNRRVRAIRLRGQASYGLITPLDSFAALFGLTPDAFSVGTAFDHINGVEVVRKYETPLTKSQQRQTQAQKVLKRVTNEQMPEHYDTKHFLRFLDDIDGNDPVVVTQKLHGTSVRLGRVLARRELTWKDKIAKFFGVPVPETEFVDVAGSRKVIKDPDNTNQNHYYDEDVWTAALEDVRGKIPDNHVLYGELIGWTKDGKPIQKGFTYDVPKGQAHLYVYRVAVVTGGEVVDLSWPAVQRFCALRGIRVVPTILEHAAIGKQYVLDIHDRITEISYAVEAPDGGFVPLSPDGPGVDEGYVVRWDGSGESKFYKFKNPSFLVHETKVLDEGGEDIG